MSLADDLKPILAQVRSIPGALGLRPYSVSVQVVSHSGTYTGEGTESASSTSIVEANSQPPKVRELNDEAKALAGLSGTVYEIGPVTPDFAGGGITWETLTGGTASSGDQVHYILTGPEHPNGVRCERIGASADRALHYKIRVKPISERD